MLKATSSNFSIIVGEALREYSADVSKAVYVAADESTSNAVDKLRATYASNGGPYHRQWRKFPKAWTRTLIQKSWGAIEAKVHLKKPMYRIGHLLEFEHASRNGGRVGGANFIEPVARETAEEFEKKVMDMIGVKL